MSNDDGMGNLILSAKQGSVIWVGYDVKITVLEVDGDSLKLSFVAPKDTPVDRDSVRRKKRIRGSLCIPDKE